MRRPRRRRLLSTTVYVPRKKLVALRALSDATGIPAARLVREGITMAIERHEAEDAGRREPTSCPTCGAARCE